MNAEVPSQTRFDVYRAVTDTIIAAIEAGAGKFTMPWHGSGAGITKPQNAVTQMEYHGINILALWAEAQCRGFGSGYWASYKQWQSVGAQVQKGAAGSTIVFYKPIQGGAEGEDQSAGRRFVARASRVFNANQVAGWEEPIPRHMVGDAEIVESVENLRRSD